jgi:hypothetical protein
VELRIGLFCLAINTSLQNLDFNFLDSCIRNGPRPPADDSSNEYENESESDSESESKNRKKSYFTGAGNRLSGAASSSVGVPAIAGQGTNKKLSKVTRTLTFWKNGFSIEDGPLFSFDDPGTEEILNALKSGYLTCDKFSVKILKIWEWN